MLQEIREKNYRHLALGNDQAIMLSKSFHLQFPMPQKIQKSFMSMFTSSLLPKQNSQLKNVLPSQKKKFIPIPDELLILVNQNVLRFYQYLIDIEKSTMSCKIVTQTILNYNVRKVKVFERGKSLKGKNFFMAVEDQTKSFVEVFQFQTGVNQPVPIKFLKTCGSILCWEFISENEILLWQSNLRIHHYRIEENVISQKQVVTERFNPIQQKIYYAKILGQKDIEQDRTIILVYILYNEKKKKMIINCRELVYPIEGKLKVLKENFEIQSSLIDDKMLENARLFYRDDSFVLRLEQEVLIIQKKFGQYYVTDNIYKKKGTKNIRYSANGNLVCCRYEQIIQINEITILDTKIQSIMIDFLDLSLIDEEKLVDFWLFEPQNSRKVYPIFIFENLQSKQYSLRFGHRMSKLKKITKIASMHKQEERSNIQKLGQVLGINKTDFYYDLWKESKQKLHDIDNFLIKCNDYEKILTELHGYLKRKEMLIIKLVYYLKKLEQMTLGRLKSQLNEVTLYQYLECIFIHRRFQMFSSDYKLDDKEFKEILNINLYDFVTKLIKQKLFPQVKEVSLWHEPKKQPPKINMMQVLSLFKLPLLQDYQEFLVTLLLRFEDNIVDVLKLFPELVPNFPFKSPVQDAKVEQSMIKAVVKKNIQIQFFSDIRKVEIKREPAFLDNIFAQLYAHHPTSHIKKELQRVQEHFEVKNKKYKTHIMIATSLEKYLEKVQNLSGLKIYIIVCQCMAKVAVKKKKKLRISQAIKYFVERHNLDEQIGNKIEKNTLFFALLLREGILQSCSSLEDIFMTPVQKFIALFFLSNKQKKKLVFHEFMNIYENKNQFKEDLRAFIRSEHCSKIQLTILVDLIAKKDQEFQKQNQMIIDVIIEGFCSRIELRNTADSKHFLERIRTIQLEGDLLIKVDKIDKMRVCLRIFQVFCLEDITLQQLLADTLNLIQNMMERFFTGAMNKTHVVLQNRKILLIEDCKGMFQLLHYLRQNIFFKLDAEDLVLVYCKKLVEWQQFDEVSEFYFESEWITNYELDQHRCIEELMKTSFIQLQRNQNLFYDEMTKEYIRKILAIEKNPTKNETVIKEEAKLRMVELFQKWGYETRLINLQIMCNQWNAFEEEAQAEARHGGIYSRKVMIQIIQTYSDYLDLESLQQLYRCFMMICKRRIHIDTKTDQFYNYCSKLADVLMEKDRLKETAEIIKIVNQCFEPNYQLMSQCLLKSMVQLHIDESVIDEKIVKRYIDFFVSNWDPKQVKDELNQKYANFFSDLLENQEEEYVYISPEICFNNHRKKISTDILWQFVYESEKERMQISDSSQQRDSKEKSSEMLQENLQKQLEMKTVYYNYFFLCMGLTHPEIGFSILEYISYNHKSIYALFRYIEHKFDHDKGFWVIDYSIFFKIYINSLTKMIVNRNESIVLTDQNSLSTMTETLENIREEIKKGRYKHDQLSQSIIKMMSLIQEIKRKTQIRLKKYELYIKPKKINLSESVKKMGSHFSISSQMPRKEEMDEIIDDQNNTLCFDDFLKMKKKIKEDKDLSLTLGLHEDATERIIVSQIVSVLDSKNKTDKNPQIPNLLDLINQSAEEIEPMIQTDRRQYEPPKKVKDNSEMLAIIESEDYTKIKFWSPDAILLEARKVYSHQKVNFIKILKMFSEGNVSTNKVQVLLVAEPDKLEIDNQLIKKLFPLSYLQNDFFSLEDERQEILNNIKPYISELKQHQILSLSSYLNDITKIQFRKVPKNDWQNWLAHLALDQLAERDYFEADQMIKIYNIVPLLARDYLETHQKEIQGHFKMSQLKDAFKNAIQLNQRQMKNH